MIITHIVTSVTQVVMKKGEKRLKRRFIDAFSESFFSFSIYQEKRKCGDFGGDEKKFLGKNAKITIVSHNGDEWINTKFPLLR